VLAHARALLTGTPQGRCEYIDADVRDIDTLLRSPALTDTFDLTRPVAVMAASVLMLIDDDADPWAITEKLRAWAPAGSYLAISHPSADVNPDAMAAVADAARKTGVTFVPRNRDQVAGLFGDWDMVDPTVPRCTTLRRPTTGPASPTNRYLPGPPQARSRL
jgi:hypothetical protein